MTPRLRHDGHFPHNQARSYPTPEDGHVSLSVSSKARRLHSTGNFFNGCDEGCFISEDLLEESNISLPNRGPTFGAKDYGEAKEQPEKELLSLPKEAINCHPDRVTLTCEQEKAKSCVAELLGVVGGLEGVTLKPEWAMKSRASYPCCEQSFTAAVRGTETTSHHQLMQPREEEASQFSDASFVSPISTRRSIFDLSMYKPPTDALDTIPDSSSRNESCRSESTGSRTSMLRTNSAEGLRVRPKPTKSLLKRCGSVPKQSCSSVSFSNLEIREYNVAISDHPYCSDGPPIQLGWNYSSLETLSVDAYEQARSPRSTGNQLLLPSPVRRNLLLEVGGYSKQDLQWAWQEVERVKRERQISDAVFRENSVRNRNINSDNILGVLRNWILQPGSKPW
jgi:hypothetical protein